MKTFHVSVAVQVLEIYEIVCDDAQFARDYWVEGRLVHTNDEALETEVLTVEEVCTM